MKYTYITFLLLLNINLTYSQVAKVKLEGGEDKASSEISDLEKRKTELTAAQRDFETGRDLLSEYYDLSFKAYETGDATYVDQAIAKLYDSKKMVELSQQKWNAYHKLNNTFKSLTQENDYNDFLRNVNELIERSKLLKTSCCGPDIVKLHLVPQNVVYEKPDVNTKSSKNKDFWIFGENETQVSGRFIINKKSINLNDYEYTIYSQASYTRWGKAVDTKEAIMMLGFTKKGMSTEDLLDKYNSEHSNWEEYKKEWKRGLDAYNNKNNDADYSYKHSIAKELPEAIDNMTEPLKVYKSRIIYWAATSNHYHIDWAVSNAYDSTFFKLEIFPFKISNFWTGAIRPTKSGYVSPWWDFGEFTESGVNTNIQLFALGLRAMHCTGNPYDSFSEDDDENKDLSKQIAQVYNYFLNDEKKNTFLEYYIEYNKRIYRNNFCEECQKRRFALSLTYQLYLDCYN